MSFEHVIDASNINLFGESTLMDLDDMVATASQSIKRPDTGQEQQTEGIDQILQDRDELEEEFPFDEVLPTKKKYGKSVQVSKRKTKTLMTPEASVVMQLANLEFMQGDYEKAKVLLQQIIASCPRASQPHQVLATIYEDQGKLDKALAFYTSAAHCKPGDVQLWRRIVGLCVELDDTVEVAIAALGKIINLEPSDMDAVMDRALLYEHMAKYGRAINGYMTVLEKTPLDLTLATRIVELSRKTHIISKEEVLQVFEKTFQLVSKYHKLPFSCTYDDSVEVDYEVITLTRDHLGIMTDLYLENKQYDKLAHLVQCEELVKFDGLLTVEQVAKRSIGLMFDGSFTGETGFDKCTPGDEQYYSKHAIHVLTEHGKIQEAIQIYEGLVKKFRPYQCNNSYLDIAQLYEKVGTQHAYTQAIIYYQKVISICDSCLEVKQNIVELFEVTGQPKAAKELTDEIRLQDLTGIPVITIEQARTIPNSRAKARKTATTDTESSNQSTPIDYDAFRVQTLSFLETVFDQDSDNFEDFAELQELGRELTDVFLGTSPKHRQTDSFRDTWYDIYKFMVKTFAKAVQVVKYQDDSEYKLKYMKLVVEKLIEAGGVLNDALILMYYLTFNVSLGQLQQAFNVSSKVQDIYQNSSVPTQLVSMLIAKSPFPESLHAMKDSAFQKYLFKHSQPEDLQKHTCTLSICHNMQTQAYASALQKIPMIRDEGSAQCMFIEAVCQVCRSVQKNQDHIEGITKALKVMDQYKLLRASQSYYARQEVLYNYGRFYQMIGVLDKAASYYGQALQIQVPDEDLSLKGYISYQLQLIYMMTGQPQAAHAQLIVI